MNEISEDEQQDMEAAELTDNLEEIISSYSSGAELSLDALSEITSVVRDRIEQLKINELPPIENEINEINLYIDKKRVELEKAKKSSVFVNDVSDDVEFHYSDHRAKHVEDEIKEQLNKRYAQEKMKFKTLEEVEELEARESVCTRLLASFELRGQIDELVNYSNEVFNDLHFDISDYDAISALDPDSLENWENNWNIIIEIIGKANIYQLKMKSLFEFFNDIKKQLEEKDQESEYVTSELDKYPDLEPALEETASMHEDNLLSSMAAVYELGVNYEVGEDYLPENKPHAVWRINKLKSIIMNIRTSMDNYKLEYKDFRKTINNIFVLLNRALQSIENQQKILKNQQEIRIKKIKDIATNISRSNLETLRQNTNDINNAINNLSHFGASNFGIEALQYYFSLKAKYPVDDSDREDIIDGLNSEIEKLNFMEIDQMCKVLEARYEPKKGIYIEGEQTMKPARTATSPVQVSVLQASAEKVSDPGGAVAQPKGKTGNLDFLGNMYLKEAQRSKGQWAAKSYLKAFDAFMKCAEVEDDTTKKLSFLKLALKTARDSIVEKEDSSTTHAYALAYRELAYNHSPKISSQGLVKIGDNFVNAGKHFIKEENLSAAKNAFKEAYDSYIKAPHDDTVKARIESVQKFVR